MNKTLFAATLASAVLAIPTYAQAPQAPQAPQAKLPEPTGAPSHLLAQAAKELKGALATGERNFTRQLDNYAKFEFSPELRPELKKIFGTERPFPLERVPGSAKGQIDYVGKLAAYTYKQSDGTEFSWTDAILNITTDRTGRSVSSTGAWPSLLVTRAGSSFSLVNMRFSGKQQRGADGVAYGDANIKLGVMTVRSFPPGDAASKEVARLDGIEVRSEVTRRGAMAEIGYRTSINAIVVGGEQVDRSNFAFRLTNIPAKVMADLDKMVREQEAGKLPDDQQTKQLLKNAGEIGKRAAIAGATLVIDDISASYRGNTASLKGRIGFQKVVEADFKNWPELLNKVVARFDVRLPVALVKDAARAFAAKSVNPAAPDAEQQIANGADGMVSVVVGKAVTSGYAVLEKEELRSVIELKKGKLIVNGKEIDVAGPLKALSNKLLPTPRPAIAPDVQPEPAAE